MKQIALLILSIFLFTGCGSINYTNSLDVREGVPFLKSNNSFNVKLGKIVDSNDNKIDWFSKALLVSLDEYNYLKNKETNLLLDATLLEITSPTWGLDTEVSVSVNYKLNDNKNKTIFNKIIVTKHISTPSMNELVGSFFFGPEFMHSYLNQDIKKSLTSNKEFLDRVAYAKNGVYITSALASRRGEYAQEGAIRKNIAELMKVLSSYNFKK